MTGLKKLFVWSGGALFIAALGAIAYTYLITWSAGGGSPDLRAAMIDAVLFGVFAAHHSLFARDRVKAVLARAIPATLLRSFYVWVASLLLMLVCAVWRPVGGDLYAVGGWRALLHAAVQLAGVGFIAASVRAIDPLELAGIRMAAVPSTEAALQVGGPYRLVRHPLYLGWAFAVFGVGHMTGDRLAFAVISTAYLCLAIPWEERSLTRAFGADYERYQRQVRWRIVPYVY
jgi:protein-S-isoprenylcysteine O-methyltransferase Ste14